MVSESNLYLYSSIISFIGFLACLKYLMEKNNDPKYVMYLLLSFGLLLLSKSLEYYEKSVYKEKNKR